MRALCTFRSPCSSPRYDCGPPEERIAEIDKAIEGLLARPPEADFGDVRRVLEAHGWQQSRQSGSHVAFTKRGERTIIVPLVRGKVKRPYVVELCKRLGISE